MSTSYYTLSLDARRRALLNSSYSPRLSDPSQFPVSAILAKLPPLPNTPHLDPPQQLGLPAAPPTSPTPDIVPPPPVPTTGSPAVNGLGIDNDYGDDLPQAQSSGSGADSGDPQPHAGPSGDLRPAFKPQPLDDLSASDSRKKKRYLDSRAIAWRTRF